jgi:hypothetical protein
LRIVSCTQPRAEERQRRSREKDRKIQRANDQKAIGEKFQKAVNFQKLEEYHAERSHSFLRDKKPESNEEPG